MRFVERFMLTAGLLFILMGVVLSITKLPLSSIEPKGTSTVLLPDIVIPPGNDVMYFDGVLNGRTCVVATLKLLKKTASRLLESVLLNVPVPPIYTSQEEDMTEIVIDGQQR